MIEFQLQFVKIDQLMDKINKSQGGLESKLKDFDSKIDQLNQSMKLI